MSGGSDVGSRVTDVGKLAGRVTARGDIPAEDLLLGMDENGRVVVRIKLDLERQGHTCKTLEADVKDLRVQLLAAQEAQRVPEEVSRIQTRTRWGRRRSRWVR